MIRARIQYAADMTDEEIIEALRYLREIGRRIRQEEEADERRRKGPARADDNGGSSAREPGATGSEGLLAGSSDPEV